MLLEKNFCIFCFLFFKAIRTIRKQKIKFKKKMYLNVNTVGWYLSFSQNNFNVTVISGCVSICGAWVCFGCYYCFCYSISLSFMIIIIITCSSRTPPVVLKTLNEFCRTLLTDRFSKCVQRISYRICVIKNASNCLSNHMTACNGWWNLYNKIFLFVWRDKLQGDHLLKND